jgi:hypothetical protein
MGNRGLFSFGDGVRIFDNLPRSDRWFWGVSLGLIWLAPSIIAEMAGMSWRGAGPILLMMTGVMVIGLVTGLREYRWLEENDEEDADDPPSQGGER